MVDDGCLYCFEHQGKPTESRNTQILAAIRKAATFRSYFSSLHSLIDTHDTHSIGSWYSYFIYTVINMLAFLYQLSNGFSPFRVSVSSM